MFNVVSQGLLTQLHQLPVISAELPTLRDTTLKVLMRHGQGAVEQIAQVVGQVSIEPVDQSRLGKAPVMAEMHLPHQEIAESIQAVFLAHAQRLDHIAQALGHLGLIHFPVPVDPESLIRLHSGRLEHGGPENGVGL